MDFEDQQAVGALNHTSRLMFGQEHKLALALLFNQAHAPITLTEAAAALRLRSASSLQRSFADLRHLGLIQSVDSDSPGNPHRPQPSSLWTLAAELYDQTFPTDTRLF